MFYHEGGSRDWTQDDLYQNSVETEELARSVDIMMARAKMIYILIIEVNKPFYFVFVVEFYFTKMTDTGSRNHESRSDFGCQRDGKIKQLFEESRFCCAKSSPIIHLITRKKEERKKIPIAPKNTT